MATAMAAKRSIGAGGSRFAVEPKDEDLTDARRVAAVGVKIVPAPLELDVKMSSGASGASSGAVSAVRSEDVTHRLWPAGTPGGFSAWMEDKLEAQTTAARRSPGGEKALPEKMSPLVGAAQAVAARGSPGWEDSRVIEGSLKTHQAAPGGGKSVHPNVNGERSVDLQTVDRLHVPDAVAGGGDALNVHSKGLDSTA